MTHLTRDVLIKKIVADEMTGCDGNDYLKSLKDAYHKWNMNQPALCRRYNEINDTNITVETLDP